MLDKIPDYVASYAHLGPLEFIVNMMVWVVCFYLSLLIVMLLQLVLLLVIVYGLLALHRLLGLPWVDGSTKGFVKRS